MKHFIMNSKFLVTAGALAVTALALGIHSHASASSAPTARTDRWTDTAGRQRTWHISLESRLQQAGASTAAHDGGTVVLTGDWVVTVSDYSPAGYDVACELQHARVAGS